MGRHRLPRYVQAWINRRHGSVWHYFRRPGFKRARLPGLPYSKEFMDAYTTAMAGQAPCPVVERPARPGTINALAISYLSSTAFGELAASTQAPYRNFVAQFCKEHGEFRVDTLQREHIVRMMDRRSTTGAKNRLRKVLRAMMQHAVAVGMRSDDPTRDVKAVAGKAGGGHHPWTEEEIAQFENHHPIGSRARLAQALLLYTGQRRGDVVRMERQHVRDGMLQVKQEKTGAQLSIPVHPDLQEIIDWAADVPHHQVGQGLVSCGVHQLVWQAMQGRRIAEVFGAWAASCGGTTIGGGGMHCARDRGDHRSCKSQRGAALYQSGGSEAACCSSNAEGENQNRSVKSRSGFDKKSE